MTPPALPPFLTARVGSVTLAIKVQPRASVNEIGGVHGAELRVKVTAPPADAAANEAAMRLIAAALGCPRAAVELVRGQSSRHKVLRIHGVDAATVVARLAGSA